ncbi:MAG: serine/threonine-protein kinase [Myxococcota bacterium]
MELRAKREPDPRVGTTLDAKLRLDRRLGKGGMGTVYEATHLLMERRVAVKLLHEDIADDRLTLKRFRREAIAASRLSHPNLVQVLDLAQSPDGDAYLVMELLEGEEWGARLERQRPSVAEVLTIMKQVASAVGAAHDARILHRDLKPENVFLVGDDDGRFLVKVLDFGISKILDAQSEGTSTKTGAAMGTPYYMSAEQFEDVTRIDARADVYSMGVMMFRALTGRYPFRGPTLPELVLQIMTEPAPSIATMTTVPTPLAELIDRMLSKDRAHRPKDGNAVLALIQALDLEDESGLKPVSRRTSSPAKENHVAFAEAAGEEPSLPIHTRTDPALQGAVKPRSRRTAAMLTIAAVLVAAGAVGIALASRDALPAEVADRPEPQPAQVVPAFDRFDEPVDEAVMEEESVADRSPERAPPRPRPALASQGPVEASNEPVEEPVEAPAPTVEASEEPELEGDGLPSHLR